MVVDMGTVGAAASAGWGPLSHHLWEATLFGTVILVLLALAGGLPARFRHGLVVVAAARFLVPSAWLEGLLVALRLDGPVAELVNTAFAGPPSRWLASVVEGPPGMNAPLPPGLALALALGWLLGTTAFLARFLIRRRAVAKGLAQARPVTTGCEAELLRGLRARLGLAVPVALCTSAAIQAPAVWGIRRPVLVLPEGLGGELTTAELELLLLHELLHVRRRDNLVAVLHRMLCCVLWFHPLPWLLERRLLAERERVVDEEVVRWSGAGELYARSLVKVLRLGLGLPVPEAAAAGGGALGVRLGRIHGVRRRSWTRPLAHGLAVAGLFFLGLLSLLPLPSVMCLRIHRDHAPALATALPPAPADWVPISPCGPPRGG
jgi:beta-lactamase regulating signal transducer with metallopeptidase domain